MQNIKINGDTVRKTRSSLDAEQLRVRIQGLAGLHFIPFGPEKLQTRILLTQCLACKKPIDLISGR